MLPELNVLKLVCQKLEIAHIPYMLTGSFAANFYAVPRMTRDIDIVIAIQEQDANRLFQIFNSDFYIERPSITDAIKNEGMFNIIHNDTVFKIDFIIRKNASYRLTEFQRKKQVHFASTDLWIVAPEDLIISKLVWAKDSYSEIQLKDIRNLLSTIKNLDVSYIENWIKNLDLSDVYKRIKIDA